MIAKRAIETFLKDAENIIYIFIGLFLLAAVVFQNCNIMAHFANNHAKATLFPNKFNNFMLDVSIHEGLILNASITLKEKYYHAQG